MKYIIFLLLISSCSKEPSSITIKSSSGYDITVDTICLDGVEYWHNIGSIAPRFSSVDGQIKECD